MASSAVLIYHANIASYYNQQWVTACVDSIRQQTCKDFDVLELDYSRVAEGKQYEDAKHYWEEPLPNHAAAQNALLDWALEKMDYEYAFNTNIDDLYSLDRIEVQMDYLRQGFDLVSSNFHSIDENGTAGKDSFHDFAGRLFSDLDLRQALEEGHNIMCHGVVAYSRNFWTNCSKYRIDEIPQEDLLLWQRELFRCRYVVAPNFLCTHRVHSRSVSERS